MKKKEPLTPLLPEERKLSEKELAYWREKEPWNFMTSDDEETETSDGDKKKK